MKLKKLIYGVILGISSLTLIQAVFSCFYNIFNVRAFSSLWGTYPIYGLAWVYYLLMFFGIAFCLVFFVLLLCNEKIAKMKQIVLTGTIVGVVVLGFDFLVFLIAIIMNMVKSSSAGGFISDLISIAVSTAALVSYDLFYFWKVKTENHPETAETATVEDVASEEN